MEQELVYGVGVFGCIWYNHSDISYGSRKDQKCYDACLYTIPQHSSLIALLIANRMHIISLTQSQIRPMGRQRGGYYIDQTNVGQEIIYLNYGIKFIHHQTTWHLYFQTKTAQLQFYNHMSKMQGQAKAKTDLHEQLCCCAIKYFLEFDRNGDNILDQDEIICLLNRLSINYNHQQIFKLIQPNFITLRGKIHKTGLNVNMFIKMIKMLHCPNQLYHIYSSLVGGEETGQQKYFNKKMNLDVLTTFLTDSQGMSQQDVLESVKDWVREKQGISFYQFCRYVFSCKSNNLIRLKEQSTDYPLTDYYVLSSHNTYLTGNQLTSDSSARIYYTNLKRGVRCLELDIHDGQVAPIIKHGFTLTKSVNFENVIQQIAKFSKENIAHTPIILSFENHCNKNNHQIIHKILNKHLQGKIYSIKDINDQTFSKLNDLFGKIIIQGTPNQHHAYPKKTIKTQHFKPPKKVVHFQNSNQKVTFNRTKYTLKQIKNLKQCHQINRADDFQISEIKSIRNIEIGAVEEEELLDKYGLIVSEVSLQNPCYQMANLSQNNILQMINNLDTLQILIEYSKKRFIRVYPFGLRFVSSNFNPIPIMQSGAQLISLNTQNEDIYYCIMEGQFSDTHNQGYTLKPNKLRQNTFYKIGEKTYSTKIEITFLYCWNLCPKIFTSDELTSLKVAFLGSQSDNTINYKYSQINQISQPFKCRSFFTRFQALNPSSNNENMFNDCPSLLLTINQIFYANIYVEIGMCGAVGLPLRSFQKGIRTFSLKGFGDIVVYVKID